MSAEIKALVRTLRVNLLDRTIAGRKVFAQHPEEPWDEDLPAVYVWALREDWTARDSAPKSFERRCELVVECFVSKDTEGEDLFAKLVDLTMQVECCLLSDPFLEACPVEIDMDKSGGVGWEFGFDAKGRKSFGMAALTWALTYVTRTTQTRADQLERLTAAGVTWDFAPPDGTAEAVDVVPLDS
jgi:hypothetical protein